MEIKFTVPIKPVAWKRPQFSNKRGYTDPKVAAYEKTIALYAKQAMVGKEIVVGSCAVKTIFYYKKTKSHSLENGGYKKITRPDIDNLLKAVLDAMNGIVYVDDGQVWILEVEKRYANDDRVFINVFAVEGENDGSE